MDSSVTFCKPTIDQAEVKCVSHLDDPIPIPELNRVDCIDLNAALQRDSEIVGVELRS